MSMQDLTNAISTEKEKKKKTEFLGDFFQVFSLIVL